MDEACELYQAQLADEPEVLEYLESRALSEVKRAYFRLGYVREPVAGHEKFQGRIVIPYLTRAGVVGMKFRAVGQADGPKYLNLPRQQPRIYNTGALFINKPYLAICEGEVDAMTAHSTYLPAIGLPGVSSWQEWFSRALEGYETIYVLADNDDKGQGAKFAEELEERLENVRAVLMPEGHDVNSWVSEAGHSALLERLGIQAESGS